MDNVKIKNIDEFIGELNSLCFLNKDCVVDYIEKFNEYLLIKYRCRKGFGKFISEIFGKKITETFVIQILYDKKEKEHHIFFDDLLSLEFDEAIELFRLIEKHKC